MKVLIVDDEPLALRRLERLLQEAGVKEVITANNAFEAKEILRACDDIDAIFLDVRMPVKDGVELAQELLSEHENLFIVFQTAYEEYTLPAFEVGAVGYLIKPFFLEDVVRVLNRIRKYRGEKQRVLFLDQRGNFILKPISEVFYFKARLKHSIGVTKDGSFICPKSLGHLEEALKTYGFFRVHRSYLVNLAKIKNLTPLPDGKIKIHFESPVRSITTSKFGAKKLREMIKIKS